MNSVPDSQILYSLPDRQHKPDKRPTTHPDAVAGKLHIEAQHLGSCSCQVHPKGAYGAWLRHWGRQKGWAPWNKMITIVNKKETESQEYNKIA